MYNWNLEGGNLIVYVKLLLIDYKISMRTEIIYEGH